MPVDLVIINGQVIDGTGDVAQNMDVVINADSIVEVATSASMKYKASRVIDAEGMVVSPGFIDPHTHASSDLNDSTNNANLNYLMQGVTTVFVGNDGRGALNLEEQFNLWRTQGIGTNAASFIGHSTVRLAAMGMNDDVPSEQELENMKTMVQRAMEAGGLGLSSGLYYAPSSYATTDEVIELAKVAASYGGVYDVHMRDEGSYAKGVIASITETIQIAEEANIHGHIAHIKCLGADVWGKSTEAIKVIEEAQQRGISITADQYPYRASGTSILGALIPRWILSYDGDPRDQLSDRSIVRRLKSDMKESLRIRGGAESILLTAPNKFNADLKGKTLAEASVTLGLDPIDAAIAIWENGGSAVGSYNMKEEDMINFMSEEWVMTGSDGSLGHPRKYGSYSKKIKEYVLDKEVLSLERMIHQSTSLPAKTFGLSRRGELIGGNYADIIVFDPAEVKDNATFEEPTALSEGMAFVLVNGQLTIENGEYNQSLAGRALRPKRE